MSILFTSSNKWPFLGLQLRCCYIEVPIQSQVGGSPQPVITGKKTSNEKNATGPRSGPAVSPLHLVAMVTRFVLSSSMTSLFISTNSPSCHQIDDRCGITETERASCFSSG